MHGELGDTALEVRLNQTLKLTLVCARDKALLQRLASRCFYKEHPSQLTLIVHVVLVGCDFASLVDHFQVLHVYTLRICTHNAQLELVFWLFVSLLLLRVVNESDVPVIAPLLVTKLGVNRVLGNRPKRRNTKPGDISILSNDRDSFVLLSQHDRLNLLGINSQGLHLLESVCVVDIDV